MNRKASIGSLFLISLVTLGFCLYLLPVIFSAENLSEVETTTSSATVTKQVAISRSTELANGVAFGSVDPNTNNNNATKNFNASSRAEYWITIDSTTNTQVALCIKADAALTKGSDTIPLTGYHWSNSTTNSDDFTSPLYPATVDLTTSYVNMTGNSYLQSSNRNYVRFSLNVPDNQAAGSYTNTLYLKATDPGQLC